ncbi:hypothetical protein [Streptomyces sp. URMC 123]|uniref:hypothetical protein n=1 Tax=Streptomyces sp. URMC 123 TaxID=3423403 RepID=UPI003F1D43FD
MSVRSAWLLNRTDAGGGQTRVDTRLAPTGTMSPSGLLTSRDGILPGSPTGAEAVAGLAVTGDAGMTAKVAPGRAVVQSTEVAGAYPVVSTQVESITFADGDAANPRIDLVVLRVYDQAHDTSNRTEAVIEVIKGTPAAAPVAPAVPSGALALAEVTVPTGASAGKGGLNWGSAVRDRRRATVAVGGVLPAGGPTAFPGAYPGQYRDNGSGLERWNGTAWAAYPPEPVWRSWTPTWTVSSGTNLPSFGNSVLNCRYVKVGRVVHFAFDVTFGSTAKYGAENWRFGLPVPAAALTQAIGYAELQGASGLHRLISRVRVTSDSTFELEISSGRVDSVAVTGAQSGIADVNAPWTWAAGHMIRGTATYEAAA